MTFKNQNDNAQLWEEKERAIWEEFVRFVQQQTWTASIMHVSNGSWHFIFSRRMRDKVEWAQPEGLLMLKGCICLQGYDEKKKRRPSRSIPILVWWSWPCWPFCSWCPASMDGPASATAWLFVEGLFRGCKHVRQGTIMNQLGGKRTSTQ